MNRSQVASLLVAAFAVLVLGVAAGSLHAATPSGVQDTDPAAGSGGGGGDGSPADSGPSRSPGRSVEHPLLSDLDGGPAERRLPADGFSPVALLGVGLLALGLVAVAFAFTGNDDRADTDPTPEPAVPERESGRSATAIRNPPPSNDVHRAWRSMTELTDANRSPEDTPTEIARRASANGFPEDPVAELTGLFRAVRYGGEPPTENREERARDALEEIRRAAESRDSAARPSGREP